jgi:hypothetical protein
MSLTTISRLLRLRYYYMVPQAGAMIGLGRTSSYDAAETGLIPTEEVGRLKLVPRRKWDARVRQLLRSPSQLPPPRKRPPRKPTAASPTRTGRDGVGQRDRDE